MNSRLLGLLFVLAVLAAACAPLDIETGDPGSTSPSDGGITVVPDSTNPTGVPVPTDPSTTLPTTAPASTSPTTTVPEPSVPSTTAPNVGVGPVFVDATDILYLESFPVQVRLVVRGSLPTPCHEARWSVEEDSGSVIEVRLWSEAALGQVCAQVLESFEVSIPLGSFETAAVSVLLNGVEIGKVSVGAEPPVDHETRLEAGWSFGMCGGYCSSDLTVEGQWLVLTGKSRMQDEPLFTNRGSLTATGLERLTTALASLREGPLQPVYGCPDCADGGAFYVALIRDGVTSRHDMEFGRPPEVLAELHALAMEMIDALETCTSGRLVTVAEDCEPWQGL